jgi:hypothetical protein
VTDLPPVVTHAPPVAAPLTGVRTGFAITLARLLRRPVALAVLLGAALVVTAAIIERRVTVVGAVDRTLAATFNLVVPLFCLAVAMEAAGRDNLREAVWPAARYGLSRRDVALGVVGASALASAALSALLAFLAVLLSTGPGNPPLAADALTAAWIGALSGAAYAGWLSLAGTFGKRGGGRGALILADFLLGGGTGLFGALLPRANAASLLGGAAPLGMTQPSSSVILAAAAIALSLLAAIRCRE